MSSPPSVPNSYWGSDTFRKDSVGWSSSLNAPDRPRSGGPRAGKRLVVQRRVEVRRRRHERDAVLLALALPLLVDEEGHDVEDGEEDLKNTITEMSVPTAVVVVVFASAGPGAGPGAGSVSWCECSEDASPPRSRARLMMLLSLCWSMMRWRSPDSSASRIRSFRTS